MKNHILKFIVFSILCVFAISTHAQTEKGRLMVGANFSQMHLSLRQDRTLLEFNVQPSIGKFVANNFAVGARMGFGYGAYHDRVNDIHGGGFTVSPSLFGRYYAPVSKHVKPFVEVETGFSQTFSHANGMTYRPSSLFAQASAGAAFFFAPNASLDLSVGYRFNRALTGPTAGNLSTYPQAKIGFNFFLPSGSKEK